MPNPYYNFTPQFTAGTKVRSDAANTQFAAIESAFDNLPALTDAITRGVSTFGVESQGANVNVFEVVLDNPRTAYQEGDEVVFKATHTNSGAATLNVDGLGAVPFVAYTGSALTSGDVTNGQYIMARYDDANTRFMAVVPAHVSLDSLTDVIAPAPTSGQILSFNGTNWVNATPSSAGATPLSLDSLTDVTITSPAAGSLLRYSGGVWIDDLVQLDELDGVTLTSPAIGDLLTFDGADWVNTAASSVPGFTPAFRGAVVQGTGTTAVDVTETTVSWTTEVIDTDAVFSGGSPTRLTVPAGVSRVRLHAQVGFNDFGATTGNRRVSIVLNGSIGMFDPPDSFDVTSPVVTTGLPDIDTILNITTTVVNVVPGDYFEVVVYQDSGSGRTLPFATFEMEIVE